MYEKNERNGKGRLGSRVFSANATDIKNNNNNND